MTDAPRLEAIDPAKDADGFHISNVGLRSWAHTEQMDLQCVRGASHAGLLLGKYAAATAELAYRWAAHA